MTREDRLAEIADYVSYLDRLAIDIRLKHGKAISRAEIIRGLIEAAFQSGIDLSQAESTDGLVDHEPESWEGLVDRFPLARKQAMRARHADHPPQARVVDLRRRRCRGSGSLARGAIGQPPAGRTGRDPALEPGRRHRGSRG